MFLYSKITSVSQFYNKSEQNLLHMASDNSMNQSVRRILGKSVTCNDVMPIFRSLLRGFPEQVQI